MEKELPKVPPAIPVLVLANHRDMGHHRTVTQEQVRGLVETAQQRSVVTVSMTTTSMLMTVMVEMMMMAIMVEMLMMMAIMVEMAMMMMLFIPCSREGPIKFAEASMFNGYGLKYIHKFFSLPFLYLQVGVGLLIMKVILILTTTIIVIIMVLLIMHIIKIMPTMTNCDLHSIRK